MGSAIMKRVRFTSYPDGATWRFVVVLDGKREISSGDGYLTQKDADMAGYKEKQRWVSKLQRGETK